MSFNFCCSQFRGHFGNNIKMPLIADKELEIHFPILNSKQEYNSQVLKYIYGFSVLCLKTGWQSLSILDSKGPSSNICKFLLLVAFNLISEGQFGQMNM